MSDCLKESIRAALEANGLLQIDHTAFEAQFFDPPGGRRSTFFKGSIDASIAGGVRKRVVVLKTVNERYMLLLRPEVRKKRMLEYFNREAGIWRRIGLHSNILELYGYMMLPDQPFPCLVSPYHPEGDLRCYVTRNTDAPMKLRIQFARDIACGLHFLHGLSPAIVHRDTRASNMLVRNEDGALSAVIIDFGSAKLSDPELFVITMGSTRISFKAWLPPEYSDDSTYANPTTYGDIWSFACTCYEVFTARDPFPDGCDIDDLLANGQRPERPPKEHVDIDEVLWELMEVCWEEDPKKRPSAGHVMKQLELFVKTQ